VWLLVIGGRQAQRGTGDEPDKISTL